MDKPIAALSVSRPRPHWTVAVQQFLLDTVMDDPSWPDDGSDDALSDELEEAVAAILCRHYGHEVIDDVCGIPSHRFCVYCRKRANTL